MGLHDCMKWLPLTGPEPAGKENEAGKGGKGMCVQCCCLCPRGLPRPPTLKSSRANVWVALCLLLFVLHGPRLDAHPHMATPGVDEQVPDLHFFLMALVC